MKLRLALLACFLLTACSEDPAPPPPPVPDMARTADGVAVVAGLPYIRTGFAGVSRNQADPLYPGHHVILFASSFRPDRVEKRGLEWWAISDRFSTVVEVRAAGLWHSREKMREALPNLRPTAEELAWYRRGPLPPDEITHPIDPDLFRD